jgi:hypothetical protein
MLFKLGVQSTLRHTILGLYLYRLEEYLLIYTTGDDEVRKLMMGYIDIYR